MPPLTPAGYGNRRVDAFGNTHVMLHARGGAVIRDPGPYRGRHRQPQPLNPLVRWLARWEGYSV